MGRIGLSLNYKKTEILAFQRNNRYLASMDFQQPDGCTIQSTKKVKYLVVILDVKLDWSYHLAYIRSKSTTMMSNVVVIAKNTLGYSSAVRKVILEGTIGAYLSYACTSFCTLSND